MDCIDPRQLTADIYKGKSGTCCPPTDTPIKSKRIVSTTEINALTLDSRGSVAVVVFRTAQLLQMR